MKFNRTNRQSWTFLGVLLMLCLAGSAMAQSAESKAIDPDDLRAFVDGYVQARLHSANVVGATVSVVHNGKMIFAQGYGHDDLAAGRKVDAQRSLFRPGSISKTLTWTAVMQLWEQGKLDLEADVQSYLPNLTLPASTVEGDTKPITMLDLMAHRPGFEESALGHLFESDPRDVLPLVEYLNQYQPQRVRAADSQPSYSNYGVGIAGLVVANLSGKPFEDYIDQHLLQPLRMDRTTFREPTGAAVAMPEALAADVSKGYTQQDGRMQANDFFFVGHVAPAGSLSTTAVDMATWLLVQLGQGSYNGVRILAPATAERLHSQHRSLDPQLPGMAHGFIESHVHGYRTLGHGGGTVFFLSDLRFIPELDFGVFISTNTNGLNDGGRQLLQGFVKELVGRYFPAGPLRAAKVTAAADTSDDVAGLYLLTRRAFSTIEKLASPLWTIAATDDGAITLITPNGPKRFSQVASLSYRADDDPDEQLIFVRNDAGEVDQVYSSAPTFVGERARGLDRPMRVYGIVVIGLLTFCWVLLRALSNNLFGWFGSSSASALTLPGPAQWAVRIWYLTCVVWVVSIVALGLVFVQLTSSVSAPFVGFPPPLVGHASNGLLVATALTLLSVLMLYFVWRGPWSLWRRARHTFAVGLAVLVVIALNHVNAIGHHYLT